MAQVSFTVSARTAKLIGQENFATAEGAIVEIVKNSYDADARNCVIIFEMKMMTIIISRMEIFIQLKKEFVQI